MKDYLFKLKEKLDLTHHNARQRMNLKSSRIKDRYDQGTRKVNFDAECLVIPILEEIRRRPRNCKVIGKGLSR